MNQFELRSLGMSLWGVQYWSMSKELSFRCEVRRREHGGWIYWIYLGDDPRESSIESYASEREALLAGYQRMEQLQPTPNPISTDSVDEP